MTDKQKLALKATLFCAVNNNDMLYKNGSYVNLTTKEHIDFDEAFGIVADMIEEDLNNA